MDLCGETLVQPDRIEVDDWSALGTRPVWIGPAAILPPKDVQAVLIGVDAGGLIACPDIAGFDVLLTSNPDAPAPWISVSPEKIEKHAQELATAVRAHPVAATLLARILRLTEMLPFEGALHVESLAYSALLHGSEFALWRQAQVDAGPVLLSAADPVIISRTGDHVTLTLNDAANANAMTAQMRDAIYAALANILDDPTRPTLTLEASGRSFSTGGHLPEFGTANDLARAHVVRTLHSCAAALHALGPRATVKLQGACIGSGIEIPAAAHRRLAAADAWFQLPELKLGLIPGAGGTVTITRAIGRHRTAWMVLSGRRVSARLARSMGLVHEVIEG